MSNYTNIIGIVIIFCILILPVNAESVITIQEKPELILIEITNYSETSLETFTHFLNHLDLCPWSGACSIHARYMSIEAEKVNLSLDEITIFDRDIQRIKRTVCSGHRVNIFEHNKTKYYTTNLHKGDTRIVQYQELILIIYDGR